MTEVLKLSYNFLTVRQVVSLVLDSMLPEEGTTRLTEGKVHVQASPALLYLQEGQEVVIPDGTVL